MIISILYGAIIVTSIVSLIRLNGKPQILPLFYLIVFSLLLIDLPPAILDTAALWPWLIYAYILFRYDLQAATWGTLYLVPIFLRIIGLIFNYDIWIFYYVEFLMVNLIVATYFLFRKERDILFVLALLVISVEFFKVTSGDYPFSLVIVLLLLSSYSRSHLVSTGHLHDKSQQKRLKVLKKLIPQFFSVNTDNQSSLKHKVIYINLLTSIFVLLMVCIAFFHNYISLERTNIRRETLRATRAFEIANVEALTTKDSEKGKKNLKQIAQSLPSISSIALYGTTDDGELFSSFYKTGEQDSRFAQDISSEIGSKSIWSQISLLHTTVSILDDKKVPHGYLIIRSEISGFMEIVRQYLIIVFLVLGFAVLMAVLLSYRFQEKISGPVTGITEKIKRITRTKDYTIQAESENITELNELVRSFNEMILEINSHQNSLKKLSNDLSVTEEKEKRKIAVDMHDSVCQTLTVAKNRMGALRKSEKRELSKESADQFYDLITESLDYVRTVMFDLSPPVLYDLGLVPALNWLSERFKSKYQLNVNVIVNNFDVVLDNDKNIFLFRSVQELLMNIVKHAQAETATITVSGVDGEVVIVVDDDGVGFKTFKTEQKESGGFGLYSIQERASYLGGNLEILPGTEKGTKMTITLPVDEFAISS